MRFETSLLRAGTFLRFGMGSTFAHAPQTAPADLQLLCANEAAQAFGMAPDSVRPVSSSVQGMVYSVVLDAGGSQAICTIDQEGTILSLYRA